MKTRPAADHTVIPPADPVLAEKDFRRGYCPVDRSTFYRMRLRGDAPPVVQLTNNRIGVRQSDAERWLESRKTR